MSSERRRSLPAASLVLAASVIACTDDGGDDHDEPVCVEIDYEGCAQLYPPTWDQVWSQTIATTCSGGGSACHADEVGLSFADQDSAYAGLVEGAHAQVIPGDPACSPLMIRLESDDPNFRMPPGTTPLAAGARCSIAIWIAEGAAQD